MSLFVKVCALADLPPGEMLGAEVDGIGPVAIYNVDGEIFATSDICSHEVALLSEGYLDGDQVECPMHGGMFDIRSGTPTHFPCVEPLRTFAVEVRDGVVFIAAA